MATDCSLAETRRRQPQVISEDLQQVVKEVNLKKCWGLDAIHLDILKTLVHVLNLLMCGHLPARII